ncbi:hypothetical protein V6Z11_D11G213900 [Gossypium hirsutum]|uniref:Uncharacterized protein isoform X1 n=1 Tax=Gossypium hirsutum TaxID=3635 RepID=A0A1U8K8H5_GOSHI|nr:uncharacterized protein LOC107913252 isoform X1 [Gossypium hirsutum]
MSLPHHAPPPPPPEKAVQVLESPPPTMTMTPSQLPALYKHRSLSPDIFRDEAWLRRKGNSKNRGSKSVTDEDLDELKACIELGFGFEFDSHEVDQRLSDTLPALGLYYAVNKNYNDIVSKSFSVASDCDSIPSPIGSPNSIFGPGDNPQTVKIRLRQWAQVVACSKAVSMTWVRKLRHALCQKWKGLLSEGRLFVRRTTSECCCYCELTVLLCIMHDS